MGRPTRRGVRTCRAVDPPGNHIGPSPLLQDPQYPADFKHALSFTQATGAEPCPTGSTFPNAATVIAYLTPPAGGTLTCYRPGIYTDKFSLTSNKDIATDRVCSGGDTPCTP